MDLTTEELRLNVRSLSLTTQALADKLSRLRTQRVTGQPYEDTLAEYTTGDQLLTRMRAELTRRFGDTTTENNNERSQ